jgi:hypothetical protein
MKRITYIGSVFTLFAFALVSFAGAQNPSAATQNPPASAASQQNSSQAPDQPLGDYARKVHKDTDPAKAKPKVFDNDNLPTDDKISVVGTPLDASNSDSSVKPADAKDASKPGSDPEAKKQADWKQWKDKVSAQKDQIDLSNRELDVLQKEYQLRAAAMYGDAGNRLRNSADWDKEDAQFKQQIADKQKAVEDAKQKLDDMQEQARKAGVPSSMLDQ